MLLLWGEKDFVFDHHVLAEWTRRFPVVRVEVFPEAAHLILTVYRALSITEEPPMTRFVAHQLATSHWFDISAARRDLGYAPSVTIDEGLDRLKRSFGP